MPTFQAIGTAVKQFKKAATVSWPTHQELDIGFLFVEASVGETVTLSTAAGFVELAGSPFTAGTTQLAVFWCRATSASMTSPVIAKPTDHLYALIATYRDCAQSGDPWDAFAGGGKSTASTSVSVGGVTTSVEDTLLVVAITKDLDAQAAFASAQTNANLTGITERFDAGTTLGNGGGLSLMDGAPNVIGATGATTIAVTSSRNAYVAIALKPPINVTVNLTEALTASGSVGVMEPFTGAGIVNLTGLTAAAQLGAPALAGEAPVTLSGVAGASAIGSVTAETGIAVSLSGLEATSAVGVAEAVLSVNVNPGRVTATTSIANVLSAGTSALDSLTAASALGAVSIAANAAVALDALSAQAAIGIPAVTGSSDVAVALDSLAATAELGTATASADIAISPVGLSAATAIGALDASGSEFPASISVVLDAIFANTDLGTVNANTPVNDPRPPLVAFARRQVLEVTDQLQELVER